MHDEQTMSAATHVRATDALRLDEDTAAVLTWLIGVCRRSEVAYDQVFIFRDMGKINKLFRSDKRGEIKAIHRSDLLRVHAREFQTLQRMSLITLVPGHWPGKWFKVNPDQA